MSKALLHGKERNGGRGYRISLPGLVIILIVFAAVLPYAIPSGDPAFLVLATLVLSGTALGLLAGPFRLETRVDAQSLMYGLLAAGAVGISQMVLQFSALSSVRAVVIFAAVAEELAFRFGVQRFAERIMGPTIALVFQAGLFMLYHWVVYPGYSLSAAYPLIAGLVFGAVNTLSRDLTPSLLAHTAVNALVAISFG